MKKWFSVKDKLPKAYIPVLVITSYGKMEVCHRSDVDDSGKLIWVDDMRAEHSTGSITHWQKLPNPPFEFKRHD